MLSSLTSSRCRRESFSPRPLSQQEGIRFSKEGVQRIRKEEWVQGDGDVVGGHPYTRRMDTGERVGDGCAEDTEERHREEVLEGDRCELPIVVVLA